jgi:hypothetical protein
MKSFPRCLVAVAAVFLPDSPALVTEPSWAQGAVIGKAMTSLESGQGLVLVLVSLQ